MFPRFSKWLTGLKLQRDEARAALSQASQEKPGHEHGHGHVHDDHDHQHDHVPDGREPDS